MFGRSVGLSLWSPSVGIHVKHIFFSPEIIDIASLLSNTSIAAGKFWHRCVWSSGCRSFGNAADGKAFQIFRARTVFREALGE
jgi:hypothetical protein